MTFVLFKKLILYVGLPFIMVTLITPLVKRMAFHIGALDKPDYRKVHKKPMPSMGGLAIFFGFLIGVIIYGKQNSLINSILIASFIMMITGIVDDINPLKAKYKFIGQLSAVLVLVFYGQLTMGFITSSKLFITFGVWAYPLAIGILLGCINCVNLIDGLDGLCAGVSGIYFLTVSIISILLGKTGGLSFILALIMFGSCVGFLLHNFYPAEIFMGDTGSQFLGLIIGVIALLGFKNVTMTSLFIPILILAIPILDSIFAILRRKLKGQSIMRPDRLHIHHQLINKNISHKNAVLIIYVVDILFASASILFVVGNTTIGYILYILLALIVIWFISKTTVIFEHNEKNK